MKSLLKPLLYETSGSSSIEYALIASLIAVVLILVLRAVGVEVEDLFGLVASAFGGI